MEYEGKVRFVLVPYMRMYSPDSINAALAAWAAWDQGKFWEMHDLLFEKAPHLERAELENLARQVGLDMDRFRGALDDQGHLQELQRNLDMVHDLDIWITPTTIVNGHIINGAQPIEVYRNAIDKALSENGIDGPHSFLQLRLRMIKAKHEAYTSSHEYGKGPDVVNQHRSLSQGTLPVDFGFSHPLAT